MTTLNTITMPTSLFPVSSSKQRALYVRMAALGIREEDLRETFVCSGGKGGQNVNKVATCVMLVHVPSGIAVKCQSARTQGLNRYYARVRLAEKLDEKMRGAASAHRQAIEKIRRQKRKRSKRAKEKMLVGKHRQADKKKMRGKVRINDE